METFPNTGESRSRKEILRDRFPTPEDWIALQGGKPRVFRQPKKPNASWYVLHVYDEHKDKSKRFQSGLVVETIPPDLNKAIKSGGFLYKRTDEDGNLIERDVVVPSFMNRSVHGGPCDLRSRLFGGHDGYSTVSSQPRYEDFLGRLVQNDFQELRFAIGEDSFVMQAMARIRPAKPLVDGRE